MDDKLDLLNDKVNLIYDIVKDSAGDIKEMRTTQTCQGFDIARNKESLIEHMKRTELLEQRIEIIEKPIEAKVYLYNWIIKAGGLIVVIVAVFQLYQYLSKIV